MNHLIYEIDLYKLFAIIFLLFSFMYFGFGFSIEAISNFLVRKGKAQMISSLSLFQGQRKFEILHGVVSIIVFAFYGLISVFLIRLKIIEVKIDSSFWILLECIFLIVWNEVHFYLCHKLMHTKWLVNFHRVHHRSVVVTPFSAYSFHPVESILLGSVMILPMFVYDFHIASLIFLPVYSILLNMIGHSNVKLNSFLLPPFIRMSANHNLHHTKFNINFGFALKWKRN